MCCMYNAEDSQAVIVMTSEGHVLEIKTINPTTSVYLL